jgi:hypothetical protein
MPEQVIRWFEMFDDASWSLIQSIRESDPEINDAAFFGIESHALRAVGSNPEEIEPGGLQRELSAKAGLPSRVSVLARLQ